MRSAFLLLALVGCANATQTSNSGSEELSLLAQAPSITRGVWQADKDALITFGASWCEPCWIEWTDLTKAELPSDLNVYIILSEPAGEGRDRVVDWAARKAPHFVLLADEKGELATAWKIKDLPGLFAWSARAKTITYSHQAYSPGVIDKALASLRTD